MKNELEPNSELSEHYHLGQMTTRYRWVRVGTLMASRELHDLSHGRAEPATGADAPSDPRGRCDPPAGLRPAWLRRSGRRSRPPTRAELRFVPVSSPRPATEWRGRLLAREGSTDTARSASADQLDGQRSDGRLIC